MGRLKNHLPICPPHPLPAGFLYGRYEPTTRARQMIKNREYRYVSAAFAKDYPDRKTGESQGLTLTSVALTNQPFLDELPEIWLSVSGDREIGRSGEQENRSPDHPITGSPEHLPRLSAEQGGNMPKLTLKCSAEGTHEAYDGDRKVGEIENDHLYDYATKHVGKDGGFRARQPERAGRGLCQLTPTRRSPGKSARKAGAKKKFAAW